MNDLDNSERGPGDYLHAAVLFVAVGLCVVGILTTKVLIGGTGLFLLAEGVWYFFVQEGME